MYLNEINLIMDVPLLKYDICCVISVNSEFNNGVEIQYYIDIEQQRLSNKDYVDRLHRYKAKLYQIAAERAKLYEKYVIRVLSIIRKNIYEEIFIYSEISIPIIGEIEEGKIKTYEPIEIVENTKREMITYIGLGSVKE